ncbi:hypothetical protein ZWY2020_056746 [Hordeum vulgare]|nr:hypothetical protein ZWY2020_056746 [Hordeum vulgare]
MVSARPLASPSSCALRCRSPAMASAPRALLWIRRRPTPSFSSLFAAPTSASSSSLRPPPFSPRSSSTKLRHHLVVLFIDATHTHDVARCTASSILAVPPHLLMPVVVDSRLASVDVMRSTTSE